MRVLFCVNTPAPYRVDFFSELGKKCELTVAFETSHATNRDKAWTSSNFKNFKAVFLKGMRIGEAEAFCPEILTYLSKKKYDIVVIGFYSSPTAMLAIEYMRLMNIPFIISSDGGVIKESTGVRYRIKQHFIKAANGWLSTGSNTTKYFQHYGAKKDKIYVYPFTSVDESDILEKPLSIDEKIECRNSIGISNKIVVLSVGQFIYRKGFDVLLKAAKYLTDGIEFYMVGGEPTDEYKSILVQDQIQNVHFVDFKSKKELIKYYQAADIFVLPTREDIWGLVINEAMAQGLAVITTDKCIAGLEMIEVEKNGMIIPADNVSQLVEAIKKAIIHSSEWGMESLKIMKKYSLQEMAEAHIQAFNEILE